MLLFIAMLIKTLDSCTNDNLEQQAKALFKSWFVDFEPFRGGEFRNLILSEQNELKNRTMLIKESSEQDVQSANTSNENIIAVLNFLREQPKATQKEIAVHIGKSERTVKTITVNLTEKGIIERKNGKRNVFWEVKTNDLNS